MSKETPEQTVVGYRLVHEHWTKFLETVRYIITKLADELIEIVARAVMLAAPLPNAISIFKTTQEQLGMQWYESLPFALTIEVIIFFLIEVALLMLQRWLDNKGKVYLYAFGAMIIVVLGATGIVIHLVREIEPHKVMAWMPVLSLCSFVAIGLKRWDGTRESGRKRIGVIRKVNQPDAVPNQSDSEVDSLLNHYRINPMHSQREAAKATGLNQSKVNRLLNRLESENKIHRNGNGVEILS